MFFPSYQKRYSENTLSLIASQVREQFVCGAVDWNILEKLYHRYNPTIVDSKTFMKIAQRIFPLGCCGIVSVYVCDRYRRGNIQTYKTIWGIHTVWCVDGYIVDCTFDQFGGKPCVVMKESMWKEYVRNSLDNSSQNVSNESVWIKTHNPPFQPQQKHNQNRLAVELECVESV